MDNIINPFDFSQVMNNTNKCNFNNEPDCINNNQVQLDMYKQLSERFSLLPVHSKNKVAAIKKWPNRCFNKVPFNINDYKDQNGNTRNAGIACGPASGVIVLDIDNVNQFNEWCHKAGLSNPIPDTFTVQSGGKSQHYYFKYPDDGKEYHKREISGAKLIGIGGYVAAPSSIHKSGKSYIVINDCPIAAAAPWMLDIMCKKISKNKNNVQINLEMFLPAPVITPAAYNIEKGV
ncbi:MAG: bifunctional DNA primase/polymerase, partial [Vampirovibrionia bacterium]